MLDKIQSRIVIILGLSGIFACIISLFFLSGITTLEFKFPLQKEEIFNKADKFLSLQGISSEPLVKKSRTLSSEENLIYLQKLLGIDKTNKFLETLPLYYWQVAYIFSRQSTFCSLKKYSEKFTQVIVEPIKGRVIGFSHFCPPQDYKGFPTLTKNEAEQIANNFFNSIDFNISEFNQIRYSSIEGKYIFEWEKNIPEIKSAKLKIELNIFGDKVGFFNYFLEIPKQELKKIKSDAFVTQLLSTILNILVIVLGILIFVISFIKRKELEWRFGLIFSLLISLTFSLNFLKLKDYSTPHIFIFLFFSIFSSIIYFFWIMLVACVAKFLAKKSNLNMFPIKIHSSILLSYILIFAGTGFTMLTFIFIQKIFKPVYTLGFYTFFSEFPILPISSLMAPLLSLSAAVSEELFFRAFLISFLNKYFKKLIWPVILSSLVWSFIHVSPVGYSDIYPSFIKGIILLPIAILLGYIFIKFGLFCAIVTHYLHDLVVIGASYLEFSNFRYANENVIAMLIAAALPLVIAFYIKTKESSA